MSKPDLDIEISNEYLAGYLAGYQAAVGARGGKAASDRQYEHRRRRAVRAMLHKKFPQDPRWQ